MPGMEVHIKAVGGATCLTDFNLIPIVEADIPKAASITKNCKYVFKRCHSKSRMHDGFSHDRLASPLPPLVLRADL